MLRRVRIDVGHGGQDPGAVGPTLVEKDVALDISRLVAAMLRAVGIAVSLTRVDDVGLAVIDRKKAITVKDVDCVVSIHANSASKPDAKGFEVYTSAFGAESQRLGASIVNRLTTYNGGITPRKPALKQRLNRIGQDYYYVIGEPHSFGIPAVLVEVGFLSNTTDAGLLATFWAKFAIAYGIFKGIADWLGVATV